MGIFDDDDLEFIEQARKEADTFEPQELNERNVQAVFNRCLATEEEKKNLFSCIVSQVLEKGLSGERESEIVIFSQDKIKTNEQNIRFLIGQLKNSHYGDESISLQEGFLRYDDVIWTKDFVILFHLYNLAQSVPCITSFVQKKNAKDLIVADKSNSIVPTLSLKDPAFPAWWEAHKGEWEQ